MAWSLQHRLALISTQRQMRFLRIFFGWFFGLAGAISLCASAKVFIFLVPFTHESSSVPPPLFDSFVTPFLILTFVLFLFSLVLVRAWWVIWKQRPSARTWGAAAGGIALIIPYTGILFESPPLSYIRWELLLLGAFAVVAFAWPDPEPEAETSTTSHGEGGN